MNIKTWELETISHILGIIVKIILDKSRASPVDCCRRRLDGGEPLSAQNADANESLPVYHNWTPVLIQCVSKRVSSFFLQKPLFTRVLLYLLTITGSTVVLKWSPWSLFVFFAYEFFIERSGGCA